MASVPNASIYLTLDVAATPTDSRVGPLMRRRAVSGQ